MTIATRIAPLLALAAILPACGTAEEERRPYGVVANDEEQTSEPVVQPSPEPVDPALAAAREDLTARLEEIGEEFGGSMGIAVVDVEDGWSTGYNEEELLPQQSVSKLWVAITALNQVDEGDLALDKPVTIRREDLTLFHQPLRAEVMRRGAVSTDPLDLIERAITRSDNTANDVLLNQVGGPEAVRAMLREKNLGEIRFGPGERLMQSAIAGLDWQQDYAYSRTAFHDARDEVPHPRRKRAFENYLANPVDGATPLAIATALARLARGTLLSEESTERLVEIMHETRSGPRRLKGAVGGGWEIAHKTGTGQYYDGRQSGYNDVGLLTSPDGRTYAIAVMIGETRHSVPENMAMMQSVTRAVRAFDEAREAALEEGAEEDDQQVGTDEATA